MHFGGDGCCHILALLGLPTLCRVVFLAWRTMSPHPWPIAAYFPFSVSGRWQKTQETSHGWIRPYQGKSKYLHLHALTLEASFAYFWPPSSTPTPVTGSLSRRKMHPSVSLHLHNHVNSYTGLETPGRQNNIVRAWELFILQLPPQPS